MYNFTSEKIREDQEYINFFIVKINDIDTSTIQDYYVTDTKKTWRGNDGWIRIIKNDNIQRINYAKKSQMTPYEREIEKYINDTYPLPQWEYILKESPINISVTHHMNISLSIGQSSLKMVT